MNYAAMGNRLQGEIDALVSKSTDIFNTVLGLANGSGDFHWSGAAGIAYADQGDEMKVDTPMFIASITKMYTAAATMILEERGMLSLDDPASKFLPGSLLDGLHRYNGTDYSDRLRVYHLISQTSGLPDYFLESPKGETSLYDRITSGIDEEWDVDRVAEIARNNISPKFPPEPKEQEKEGKKAFYSDTNYQLLGAIIEAATEKQLHNVFAELIIQPLELSSTYLHGYEKPAGIIDRTPADIYYKETPLRLDKAMKSFGPDGGMVSNVEDSLKFIRHFMEGMLFEQPSTLERMKNWKRIFSPLQYGLGLMRFKLPRLFSPFSPVPELIGHSGSSSSFLFYRSADPLYIAGTLNQIQNQGRPFRFMLKIAKIYDEGRA